jgi:hypothetical protein
VIVRFVDIGGIDDHHFLYILFIMGNPGPVIPIFITGFPTAIHILVNDEKHAHIRFHSQRSHTITKMNDNMNMDIF